MDSMTRVEYQVARIDRHGELHFWDDAPDADRAVEMREELKALCPNYNFCAVKYTIQEEIL